MKTQQKREKRQSVSSIIENNLFVLRIVWKLSKCRFVLKFLTAVIAALLPTLKIIITWYIIAIVESDVVKNETNFSKVLVFVLLLMGMQIVPKIFSIWNATLIEPVLASKINLYMNEVFIDKVKEFDYKSFEDSEFYDKYTRALGQVDTITHTVFNTFFELLSGLISIISLIALIVTMDWIIILFALFSVFANFIQSLILSKLNYTTNVELTPIARKQNYIKRILYIPDYAKDIKTTDILATGKKYYTQSLKSIVHVLKQYGLKAALISTGILLLTIISSATMMIMLFKRVWIGEYLISDYTALTGSVTQLENVLGALLSTITSLYNNSMYIDDLRFVYKYSDLNNLKHIGNKLIDTRQPCKIEARNLYFKYPNTKEYALQNVSFVIQPGEKIAVVGLNGSGKTTLIKLILGLYEPEKGEILINDTDIREYKHGELLQKIGVVFQDHHVYAYTLKENISFEDELGDNAYRILEQLNMRDKIEFLPKGFDTHLSKEFYPDGVNLSGGETQKICIARAINKDCCLYIFDEPSSALDIMSENRMNEVLVSSFDKTMIFISHRLSTIVMMDRILVFEKGILTEEGSHESLLKADGTYASLFNQQRKQHHQE